MSHEKSKSGSYAFSSCILHSCGIIIAVVERERNNEGNNGIKNSSSNQSKSPELPRVHIRIVEDNVSVDGDNLGFQNSLSSSTD